MELPFRANLHHTVRGAFRTLYSFTLYFLPLNLQSRQLRLELRDSGFGDARVGQIQFAQSLQGLQEYKYIVFGPLLVLLIMFMPGGLASLWAG